MKLNLIEIDSVDDSRVTLFQSLKLSSGRFEENGVFLVEGEIALRALLKSKRKIQCLFMDHVHYEMMNEAILARLGDVSFPCYVAKKETMSELVGFHLHQGVLAMGYRPDPVSGSEMRYPAIALNGIDKAENVGTIIRTGLAFGVSSFIVDAKSTDPYVRRAVRVSMGAVCFARIQYVDFLYKALGDLVTGDTRNVILLEQGDISMPVPAQLPSFDVIVIGNEGEGVDEKLFELADGVYEIPMDRSNIGSLNVSVALGVALSRCK
jgi:tRNA G18 (ribose-2'-O)-methylase SpoU